MGTRVAVIARLTTGIAVVSLIVIAGVVSLGPPEKSDKAVAADLSQFRAGNIISDSVFFDGTTMRISEVQAFLNARVPTCIINDGNANHAAGAPYYRSDGSVYSYVAEKCLKDYAQATPNVAAQPGSCAAYTGRASESAASIITRVGRVCNISPKVLLVLLQKEQVLVTDTWPLVKQYTEATGFECYDNGLPCVGGYAGFFFQVWAAARQFQRYGTGIFTWYPVGSVTPVLYHPTAACGTLPVLIENRATAALYYYTPYTPNAASLAASYGTGDSCSSYGNRNFYQMYVDWFGSTRGLDSPGEIGIAYQSLGGASGKAGHITSTQACGLTGSGCSQNFQNGVIYWSPTTGANFVSGPMLNVWTRHNREAGWLGYPFARESCRLANDGCSQRFTNGFIVKPATSGARTIRNDIRRAWGEEGYETGWLGYPVSQTICTLLNSGCFQKFQNGVFIYSAPFVGAHPVRAEVRAEWKRNGFVGGRLGYPTSGPSADGTTYTQTFQGGSIAVTNGVAVAN
jgi:hypothetical protein